MRRHASLQLHCWARPRFAEQLPLLFQERNIKRQFRPLNSTLDSPQLYEIGTRPRFLSSVCVHCDPFIFSHGMKLGFIMRLIGIFATPPDSCAAGWHSSKASHRLSRPFQETNRTNFRELLKSMAACKGSLARLSSKQEKEKRVVSQSDNGFENALRM